MSSERATRRRRAGSRAIAWALVVAGMPAPLLAAPPEPPEPAPPIASEPKTAVEWYARGIELAQAEDYLGAAEAFLRSYELKPTPEALFNAALAYETGERPLEAIATYRRHLAEPKADPEQQARAQASIDALLREVAVIKGVRFDPERAPVELWIAGERHQLDEFPLPLSPGEITVEIVDAEGIHGRESYSLEAGEALVLDLRALWPAPEPEPEIEPEPEPELGPDPRVLEQQRERAKALEISTWTGLGLTGLGLIAVGVSGGFALDYSRREAARVCDVNPCPEGWPTDRPELIQHLRDAELATNVAIGVSAVLAVATLAVGISAIRANKMIRRGERTRASTRVRLRGLGFEF
ncbi:hypothetical protein ACNOYE_12450 [Nannocystaceae bacterium ST9]